MRIVIIAYDQISLLMLSTPLTVFGQPLLKQDHHVSLCADSPSVVTSEGLTINMPNTLEIMNEADIIILPGWRNADEALPASIIEALQAAHERGAIVVGLCLGAFGIAQAGLLNGKRATTHWRYASALAARFPDVRVDGNALFADEGLVVTSAGIAAGLDCCLHILARIVGTGAANRVARDLVIAPQRAGNQPQFLERPTLGSNADTRLCAALEKLRDNPHLAPSLDELAKDAGMTRRTFSRHIRARTGGNLGEWLRRTRIARAQDLLVSGMRGIEEIAAQSGFTSDHALRLAFKAELGVSPTEWLSGQRVKIESGLTSKRRPDSQLLPR